MDDLVTRLNNAFDYLRNKGLIHSKRELAKAINRNENHIIAASNGNMSRCTLGLMKRLADTFPDILNRDYLLSGEGQISLPDASLRPHIADFVSAGFMSGFSSGDFGDDLRPSIPTKAPYDFTIEVIGDSMLPRIEPGEILACRFCLDRANLPIGHICIIDSVDGAVVKVIKDYDPDSGMVTLHSYNSKKYPDYDIPATSINNVAVVIGSLRTF